MYNLLVTFRGNKTTNIIIDFKKYVKQHHSINFNLPPIIIYRKDVDRLAKKGDISLQEAIKEIKNLYILSKGHLRIILIANGGSTCQSMPFVHWLFQGQYGYQGTYEVWDCQKTETRMLLKREALNQAAKIVGICA